MATKPKKDETAKVATAPAPAARAKDTPAKNTPAMSRARKLSLAAGVIAAINEAGLRNVMASTAFTIAAPMTATVFVYEVNAMRQARLAYEAADRAQYAARLEAGIDDPAEKKQKAAIVQIDDHPDMTRKLDAMIASRTALLDTFGDDSSTVAPVYQRVIRQMLHDDDDTFASLTQKRDETADDADALAEKEARLRSVHDRLTHLAGV